MQARPPGTHHFVHFYKELSASPALRPVATSTGADNSLEMCEVVCPRRSRLHETMIFEYPVGILASGKAYSYGCKPRMLYLIVEVVAVASISSQQTEATSASPCFCSETG